MDQADASLGFTLADFNKLVTKAKRINTAWTGGTPEASTKGITDLLVSPETMEDLRAMAYNPVNTSTGPAAGAGTGLVAAPESFRSGVFTNGGVPELYGIGLMEMNELGRSRKFSKLFQQFQTASTVTGKVGFGVNDDLVIGIDRSRESLIRASVPLLLIRKLVLSLPSLPTISTATASKSLVGSVRWKKVAWWLTIAS